MKLLHQFLLLSRGKQIALTVFLSHFFIVLALFGHHLFTRQLRPPRPMVIRTLAAQPPPRPLATAPVAKATPAPAKPKAKPSAPAKKATPKASAAPQPVVKKTAAKEEDLLQEIAANLQALSTETKPSRSTLTVPSKLASKAEIKSDTPFDPTAGEILIAYLQNELDLPEYGEVRAKIEIDRFGKLVSCQILEAKSAKNAAFLKNRLPELAFPCLNDSQSFTITFRNVEIR
jgi:hypothetical protein